MASARRKSNCQKRKALTKEQQKLKTGIEKCTKKKRKYISIGSQVLENQVRRSNTRSKQGKIWRKIIKIGKCRNIYNSSLVTSFLYFCLQIIKINSKLQFLCPNGYLRPWCQYRPTYLNHKFCLEIGMKKLNLMYLFLIFKNKNGLMLQR